MSKKSKNKFGVWAICIAILLSLLMLGTLYYIFFATGDVAGNVIMKYTEKPINQAKVQLFDSDGILVTQTYTNEEGWYYIEDLPPGNYTIVISKLLCHNHTGFVEIERMSQSTHNAILTPFTLPYIPEDFP